MTPMMAMRVPVRTRRLKCLPNPSPSLSDLPANSPTRIASFASLYHAEEVAQRVSKFGDDVVLRIPGLRCGEDRWIPGNEENLEDLISQYWADFLLGSSSAEEERREGSRDGRGIVSPSRQHDHHAVAASATTLAGGSLDDIHFDPRLVPAERDFACHDDPTALLDIQTCASETLDDHRALDVILPNGLSMSRGCLVRCLLDVTPHYYEAESPRPYYYFRGAEGMEAWSAVFFDDVNSDDGEDDVVAFARMLIGLDLVHNYTPLCRDLRQAVLVLQPLRDLYCINSLLKWPSNSPSTEDPMSVLLRLSAWMDDIYAMDDSRQRRLQFESWEEAACEYCNASYI